MQLPSYLETIEYLQSVMIQNRVDGNTWSYEEHALTIIYALEKENTRLKALIEQRIV